MSNKKFEVGDLVWSKMKSYPFWPSKIVNPPANIKTPSSKKAQHCVFFFGTGDYGWISDESIVPHSTDMIPSSCKGSKKISSTLQSAIDEIVQLSENKHDNNIMSINGETDSESSESILESPSPQISNRVGKKALKELVINKKEKIAKSQKVSPKNKSSECESSGSEFSDHSSDHSTKKKKIAKAQKVPLRKKRTAPESSGSEFSDSSSDHTTKKKKKCSASESGYNEFNDSSSDHSYRPDEESKGEESKDEESKDEESKDEESKGEESKDEGSDNVFSEDSQNSEKSPEKKVSKIKKNFTNKRPLKRPKKYPAKKLTDKRKCISPPATKLVSPISTDSNTDSESIDDYSDDQHNFRPEFIERPASPDFNVRKASDFLQAKEITPTNKKIGFLGLGMIGRGVVKNLLHSGHKVTIWNRHPHKCEPFVEAGACLGLTPADVVASCDITFCCVSDSVAVKQIVFENCGVIKGLEGSTTGTKGYVEMSSIDTVTSQEVSKAIKGFGGRYLEAPVIGSRQLAEEGSLLSLVAGDRALFNDCYSCFFAFTRNVYYLSSDTGSGCKMNLIQSMLFGTTSAALAEAVALVKSCELSLTSFMEILEMGPLNCPLVLDRGNAMANENFTTNTALKHQQKDLSYVLKLSNACLQSTLTSSAANQLFKRAEHLKYSDHDVSAVLMGVH